MVRLLVGYEAAVSALIAGFDALSSGGSVEWHSYLIEPGESTRRVLAALEGALARGARAEVSVDGTWASWLSRFWERTGTSFGELERLARRFPAALTATRRREADHSKYAIFEQPGREPLAVLGGVNVGDRFAPWRDFAVLLEGPEAADLRRVIDERFAVRQAFEELLDDAGLSWIRIAMAYVDRAGASLVERALRRGARVELIVPARANVYQNCNMRALASLRGARVLACRSMVHAKVFLAGDDSAPRVALLGSANLKRNSLDHFRELDARVTEPAFLTELAAALDALAAESAALERFDYSWFAAAVEERFG